MGCDMEGPTTVTGGGYNSNRARAPGGMAILGTVLVLVGGFAYLLFLDNPWIRSKAIPNTVLILAGLLLCGWAVARKRSLLTVAAAVFSLLFGALFLISVFLLTQLPKPAKTWDAGATVPDFTLPNQDGETIQLSSFHGRGPVLLVFYRGHW